MRNSTDLDPLTQHDSVAPRGRSARSDIPLVTLWPGAAGNDAVCEDPAISTHSVEPRAHDAPAGNDVDNAAAADTATSFDRYRAARAHRSAVLGAIVVAGVRAVIAVVRRARARYEQRRQARIAYDALRELDDHTLRDLGFDRSEIASVAAEVTGEAACTRIRAFVMPNALPS